MPRYVLTTRLASEIMPPLPERCPHCGGAIVVAYDTPAGHAGGHCEKDCGWTFQRRAVDPSC